MRGRGLAEAGISSSSPSIVSSAVRLMSSGATRSPSHDPFAERQQMFLEHDPDRVEVVLGRKILHRVVLVVETAVRLGVLEIAAERSW